MSQLTLENNTQAIPDQPQNESEEKTSREWKPTVRVQKRDESPRQKLRIRDLYPDKQYIKDVTDHESRYFLLLIVPVVVTAIYSATQREDLYSKLVEFFVKFFGNI